MDVFREVSLAEKRIRKYIRETPLEFSPFLSRMCNCNVYLKLESEQLTGSFKIRGAFSKLLSLNPKQRKNGIVAYSTGNHALAVAYGAELLGIPATIFVPYTVPKEKRAMLRYYPAQIKTYKKSSDEPEITAYARIFAKERGMAFVSPYNDPKIISGQGTIGYEIWNQLPHVDAVFVCVGGGGLVSGIGGYLKSKRNRIRVVGSSPKNSAPMYASIQAGKVVDVVEKDTLSDGSAGNNEHDTITFGLCKKYVDQWDLVSEKEIRSALLLLLEKHHKLVEGAAAVPLASLLRNQKQFKGKNVVLVICGSNISIEKIRKLLS